MLLYDAPVSGNCYKVRLLMALLGIECERREVDVIDRSDPRELLADLNPTRSVPTLVLDDGRPLAESNAILCYLARRTPLLPAENYEHAKVLQWLFFEQYSHEPNIAIARFLVSYATAPPPGSEREARRDAEIATRQKLGYRALDAMERTLSARDFLAAGCFTIADISLYAYTHVAHEGGFDLARYPAIGAWLERIATRPGHVPITA
jgi:glutathione S-transferase